MSRLHTIDIELAKILRSQGLTYADIAKQAGGTAVAIRAKACREGWNAVATRARAVLKQHGIEAAGKTIKEQAPKLAEQWLAAAQEDTIESIEAIRKLAKPTSLEKMKQREEMLLTHVKRGRAAFGLDDQKGGGVQINIMSQLAQIATNETPMQRVAEYETNDATPVSQTAQVVDIEGD